MNEFYLKLGVLVMGDFSQKISLIHKMAIFFILFIVFISTEVLADSYTHQEIDNLVQLGKLPDYCSYMGVGRKKHTPLGKKYRKTFGPDWIHMHHYCWALVDSQRGYDGQAIDNLNYVLRNSRSDFKLRPMVLKQKARILMINNNLSAAAPVYSELIKVKPDDEEGYLGLAEIFLSKGDKNTAREVVELGLKNIPDSGKLQKIFE